MIAKVTAVVLGVLALGGLVVIIVAESSVHHSNAMGPLAFLLCIVAVAAMIVLGVTLGGRNNPRRGPMGPMGAEGAEEPAGREEEPGQVPPGR